MTIAWRRGAGIAGLAAVVAGAFGLAAGAGLPAVSAIAGGLVLLQFWVLAFRPVRVPVVMLHSIVGDRPDRPGTFPVWCPPACFEGYLRYLQRRGYHTVTLAELHAHTASGAPLPSKPIVLTFDDGYLDNWVHAAPLLRRYGFTGTVFVPADFIEAGAAPRPTIDDVAAGRVREADLAVYGYMNAGELRAAAQSGVLDVQSHGRTHTWLPVSEEVIDFHRPDLPMRHLRPAWWNANPARKPRWFQEIAADDLPWGAPVYRNELALSRGAFFPDPTLEVVLIAHVAARGGRTFFDRVGWRDELNALVRAHREKYPATGAAESPEAFRARLVDELRGSREKLEAITGRPVRFMCWPNGGTCDEAFALLSECGYLGATLPSRARQPLNHRETEPGRIGRISATSFFRGTHRPFPWILSFALKVERNRGNGYAELPIKAIWLYRRFVPAPGERPAGAGG
jgi:peptidoglycan/xylan/chitin deacetylase (PgdA/CDA1 family)